MSLRARAGRALDFVHDLMFPAHCIGCDTEGEFLCAKCSAEFSTLNSSYCQYCGLPIVTGPICLKCLDVPLVIDGIRSLYLHEGVARDAVHAFKYNNLKALAGPLAKLMKEYLESNSLSFDIVAAVPMHSSRIRKRGYNQAALLANELGQLVEVPVAKSSLRRRIKTPSQVSLGANERRSNVEGAFNCENSTFKNRRVLVIDDVCTTGATLNACAAVLKEAGAASVWGLTFSREC